MSAGACKHVVLAIRDPGLRAILIAQLGMTGELLISTPDHLDPRLSPGIRMTALLIIEACLIAPASPDWAGMLRNQYWAGNVIVIFDSQHDLTHRDDKIYLVDRRGAITQVLMLMELWQAQYKS